MEMSPRLFKVIKCILLWHQLNTGILHHTCLLHPELLSSRCLVSNCKQIRTRANNYNWIPQASTVPVVSPHNRPSPASLARFTVHLSKAETSMFIWLRSLKGTSNSVWNFNTSPVASHIVRYLIDNPTGKTSPTSKVSTLKQSVVRSLFACLPIKHNQKSSSGSGSDTDIRFLSVSLVFTCRFFFNTPGGMKWQAALHLKCQAPELPTLTGLTKAC